MAENMPFEVGSLICEMVGTSALLSPSLSFLGPFEHASTLSFTAQSISTCKTRSCSHCRSNFARTQSSSSAPSKPCPSTRHLAYRGGGVSQEQHSRDYRCVHGPNSVRMWHAGRVLCTSRRDNALSKRCSLDQFHPATRSYLPSAHQDAPCRRPHHSSLNRPPPLHLQSDGSLDRRRRILRSFSPSRVHPHAVYTRRGLSSLFAFRQPTSHANQTPRCRDSFVRGPTQDTYVRLSQVLRQLKDPRILVLAHPSFRFPSLPNLYRYPRNCSSYHGRNQPPNWAETEQFALNYVQGLKASV
ncbi:hypothetical protein BDZ89DRAFT_1083808, partial [Hymenopellis radicata]